MNYRDALAWLYATQRFGIKLGLEHIRRLLAALDLPSPAQRFIHVAGTNGKGSVCVMLDAMLRAGGSRTGLFTSPHLVTFRERIQVNGELISEADAADGLTQIRDLVHAWEPHPTFFEIVTALALRHFSRKSCELVVLETGMGGRLDATNAVVPVVSVITPISYDHQKWLGETLAAIAGEKAGIIKPRVPVVSALQPAEAKQVIRRRAAECEAPLRFVSGSYEGELGLAGAHQKQNAALAVAALEACALDLPRDTVARTLQTVAWPARFQRWNEQLVIDGAHNPAGARVLATTWRETFGDERATLILGLMRDKHAAEICRELLPLAAQVFLPAFRGERVMSPEELSAVVQEFGCGERVATFSSAVDALAAAQRNSRRILVAGSLHLAGEILAHLDGRPAAFEESAQ